MVAQEIRLQPTWILHDVEYTTAAAPWRAREFRCEEPVTSFGGGVRAGLVFGGGVVQLGQIDITLWSLQVGDLAGGPDHACGTVAAGRYVTISL